MQWSQREFLVGTQPCWISLISSLTFFVDFAVTPWLTCVTILDIVLRNFQSHWLILPKSSAGQETLHQGSCSSQGSILCYCPLFQLQTLNYKAVHSTHSPFPTHTHKGKANSVSDWWHLSLKVENQWCLHCIHPF